MKKNKGFLTLWIITIILFVLDLGTTLYVRQYAPYAETNPLYQLTQSFLPIILANLIVIGLLYWAYNHKRVGTIARYGMICIMIMLVLPRLVAVGSAVSYAQDQPSVEVVAESITPEMRDEAVKANALLIYAPLLLAVLAFVFWKWDHQIQRKDRDIK